MGIKTRAEFPFMYFLIEPNIVYVYKIKTLNYVTVASVSENGQWATYELKDSHEFQTFNYEKHRPLEGRGYIISQDYINMMVEEINKEIQNKRQQGLSSEQVEPIHLVLSVSAAGPLKVGLPRPKTVIGFPDSLSIGPLWKLHEKKGLSHRNEWIFEHINFEQDHFEYINKFNNAVREIEDIPHEAPIYLWTSNNASEQTAIRFFIYLLREKSNELFLLDSTDIQAEEGVVFSTGHMNPTQVRFLFEKNQPLKPLSYGERAKFEKEWESLAETSMPLRIWVNNEIIGVQEDYFDTLIIEKIKEIHRKQQSKDFILAGAVIGEILETAEEFVDAFYLEYRIRHLIYSGPLELKGIPKSMRHYRVKLPS